MPSRSKYLIFMDSRALGNILHILASAGFEQGDLRSGKDRAVAVYSNGTYGFVFARNPGEVCGSVPMSGHCRASQFTEEIARSLPGARLTKKEPRPMQTPTKFEPGQRWRFVATRSDDHHGFLEPGDEATVKSVIPDGDALLADGKGYFGKARISDGDIEFLGMDPAPTEPKPAPVPRNGLKPGDRIRFLRTYAAPAIAPKGFETTIESIDSWGTARADTANGEAKGIHIGVDLLGKFFELVTSAPVFAPCVFRDRQTQPKKDPETMNYIAPIKLQTRVFADNQDIAQMSNAVIASTIKLHKADIAELKALNEEPVAKITAEIKSREAGLKTFIAAVNALPAKAAE